uniref:TLDc domain-containing protein n=1 Tax=Ornithorhynchus anatinus TaxID=9258 RepID=A0A6I8PMI9_ORNAN
PARPLLGPGPTAHGPVHHSVPPRMKGRGCRYTLLVRGSSRPLAPPFLGETPPAPPGARPSPTSRRRPSRNPHTLPSLDPHLPPRVTGCLWTLLFCTARDGFSLRTLYRMMEGLSVAVLLVVRDTGGQVRGPPGPTPPEAGPGPAGPTGQPDGSGHIWTNPGGGPLSAGGDRLGPGRFGLWLDGDLNHGGSSPCATFDNEVLSHREEFRIQELEAWAPS